MATEFAVLLPAGSPREATDAALEALEVVGALEEKLSVYRPSSEISRVNRLAAEGPVRVDREVFALLERSLALAEQTGGAFDITAGPLVEAWGFMERRGRKPSDAEIAAARERVGYQHVRLDRAESTVAFDRPGMAINLGAIGKGYALDRAAVTLRAAGVDDFLIHGGRSSIRAAGGKRVDREEPVASWGIALRHPTRPAVVLGKLALRDRSLATSGSGQQFFHFRGRRLGHVIDPRTGWPAGDLLSLTLVCRDATTADALATGLFVMGHEAACAHLATLPDVGMIAVAPHESRDGVRIESWGLDGVWTPEPAFAADSRQAGPG